MSTEARTIATTETTHHATGPRTEEGKSTSAKNALKTGLYAASEFIPPEEQSHYDDLQAALKADLCPSGILEAYLVDEILGAMWRLHRCSKLEGALAAELDPMDPESPHAKRQLSIDRARNQATRLLHKNMAELRRLQTERQFRVEIAGEDIDSADLGLCDFSAALARTERAIKGIRRREYNKLDAELSTAELELKLNDTHRPTNLRNELPRAMHEVAVPGEEQAETPPLAA